MFLCLQLELDDECEDSASNDSLDSDVEYAQAISSKPHFPSKNWMI